AVISETIPGLRGRFGTSILIMLLFIGYAMMIEAKWYAQVIDFSGIVLLQALFKQSALESGHRLTSMMILGGNDHLSRAGTHDLVFQPLTLTSTQWLCIGGSVLLSLMLVGLAGLFLERRPLARRMTHQRSALRITLPEADANEAIFNAVSIQHFSWPALWRQAMKQLLASRSVGWWLILAGLWIANWLAPTSSLRSTLLPITYLWALLFFSQLGWPEQRNGLATWLTTINFAEKRHLNVTLLVAGCFSILLALPTCIRLGVTAWPLLSWALMLPVVAMLLGFVTKTGQWTQLIVTVLLFFVVAGLSGILPVATTATGILTGVGYLMIGAASLVGLELAV
ncbi:ABC transporter permease, partial [Lacticaseibacillus rhamnosus]